MSHSAEKVVKLFNLAQNQLKSAESAEKFER